MICPDCHTKVMSFAEYCKKCGADLQLAKEKKKKHYHPILGRTF